MSASNKKRCLDDAAEPESKRTHFSIKSRQDDFSERTWWMVDIDNCDSNQGATALVKRCMRRYGWSLDKTKNVLQGYRQFLTLKKINEDWDATILSPSHLVDQMWHQHILDLGNYCHDMLILCDGHIVLHNPDGALDDEAKKLRDEKTRAELINHFGSDSVDREVWGFPSRPATPTDESNPESSDDNSITIFFKKLVVDGQKFEETYFKVSRTIKLGRVFQTYANRQGVQVSILRFLWNGERIRDDWTPKYLEMENLDQIDVVLDQCGC